MNINIEKLYQADLEHLWHPLTQMSELKCRRSKIIVEGKGIRVKDIYGREYIDLAAHLSANVIGHGRKEIAEVVAEQMKRLEYVSLFDFFATEPAIELAERLAEITSGNLKYVCFGCSGSEAIEIALKISRQYQIRKGFSNRYKVISRMDSFHGATMGALSVNGLTELRRFFEPLVPGSRHIPTVNCWHCPFAKKYPSCGIECAEALERQIIFEDPETVAAFVAEPVPVPRGVVPPPKEYFPEIREICDKYGVIFIADEIVTGFGKTGKMFACEDYVTPDIMVLGKGLSSGYFPISAVVVKPEIYDAFLGQTNKEAFLHGQTYQGHPVGCVVALKNIEIIEKENLVARAVEVGNYFHQELQKLLRHEIVCRIMGKGILQSVELIDRETKRKISYREGVRLREKIFELGCICRIQGSSLIMFPPLVLTKEDVDEIVDIIDRAISEVE